MRVYFDKKENVALTSAKMTAMYVGCILEKNKLNITQENFDKYIDENIIKIRISLWKFIQLKIIGYKFKHNLI